MRQTAPGLVDLQVNGFAGVDYGSAPDAEAVERSIRAQFACGVTRFLATVITAGEANLVAALGNLSLRREQLGAVGQAIAGIHVEGPNISALDGPRGAHPAHAVRPPSIPEFERWQEAARGQIRLVTLAPEWPGALSYIEEMVKRGVTVAVGHTAATGEQIRDAVAAGATLATHLGNATFPAPPKWNPLWEQLADDRMSASVIADGFHLPESFLRVAYRAKTPERLILVTDAAAPAGAAPGHYKLGEVDVELSAEGKVTLAGGTRLAGSALKLNDAVANMVRMSGCTLEEALTMATVNSARAIGLDLVKDFPSDSVEFEWTGGRMRVLRTSLAGECVHNALY